MRQHGFVAAGWASLHQAVLDRGAEVDYYAPDYPELRGKSYVYADLYRALVGRVLELADIDIESYGYRSTLISRAIWRWVSSNAECEMPQHWRRLTKIKSWTALLAAFKDWTNGKQVLGGPCYAASDLPSVVRFGYWLFREGKLPGSPTIITIAWGLALIGSAWDLQLRCDRCQLCFRRARPGEAHCDFHSQSTALDLSRSEAFQRYRHGRLARDLALKDTNVARFIFGSKSVLDTQKRLVLPDVLFPLVPLDGDYSNEHDELISSLESSPRVVSAAGVRGFRTMSYEILVERLRKKIDPYNWNNDLWAITVFQAELWLKFEEEVCPGTRGRGQKTSAMVDRAIDLATSGHSKRQIAKMLGITPSAVSHWIRRYPKFRQAFS